MAMFGMLAFSAATQRWIRVKTNPLEIVLLLAVTIMLMIPNMIAQWFSLPHEYVSYAIGMAILVAIYLWQISRQKSQRAVGV